LPSLYLLPGKYFLAAPPVTQLTVGLAAGMESVTGVNAVLSVGQGDRLSVPSQRLATAQAQTLVCSKIDL